MAASLKSRLQYVGSSRVVVQFKIVTGDPIGVDLYLSKDYGKAHFQGRSTTASGTELQAMWERLHEQWKEQEGNVFGELKQVRPDQLIGIIYDLRAVYKVLDAGFLDWALWSIREKKWALGRQFLGGNNGHVICQHRLEAYWRLLSDPVNATQADVYTVVCGRRDLARSALAAVFFREPGATKPTRVNVPSLFNQRYSGCGDIDDAVKEWLHDPNPRYIGRQRGDVIPYEGLRPWQRNVADLFIEPEDAMFGRTIHYIWEAEGNTGKSALAKYLATREGGLMVTYSGGADVLFVAARYIAEHGCGPLVIVINIPRGVPAQEVDYIALEQLKDGSFVSTKYDSRVITMDRPHIVMFANEPPAMEKISADRWVVATVDQLAAV